MDARRRVLSGLGIGGYIVRLWIQRSVSGRLSPELIALMTLALLFYGKTEFASLHILRFQVFCPLHSQNTEADLGKSIQMALFSDHSPLVL